MPYWSIYCFSCHGDIADALPECLPAGQRSSPVYKRLFNAQPGAVLACPYCKGLIGFDSTGNPRAPESAWPVFRYGRTDGEPPSTALADWALKHRFTQPSSHQPLTGYT